MLSLCAVFEKNPGPSKLVVAAQDVHDLVLDQILHILAAHLQIAAGVEVGGVRDELLPHAGGHGQAEVRVDVDLADGELGGLAQLILRHTDGVRSAGRRWR